MPATYVLDVLEAFHPISETSKRALEKELVALSLPKNHFLLEAPRIADQLYFLRTGFAMGYSYVDSEKFIETFWKQGQIVTSATSFFEQVPSMEFIQLMDNAELLCLSHAGFQRLIAGYHDLRQVFFKVISGSFRETRISFLESHTLTATQRHQKLLQTYPGIEQIVPQENIASWLGITPQSLSRIKRRH